MSKRTSDANSKQASLEALLDERAIHASLVRYCRGVDRCDEALIRSAYHPDATDEHGEFSGSGHEFAAYVVKTLTLVFEATTHVLGNVTIALEGDEASVESYVTATHRRTAKSGATELAIVGARYLDRFARRDGEWKIARRVTIVDWSKVERHEHTFPDSAYRRGARGEDDPTFGQI